MGVILLALLVVAGLGAGIGVIHAGIRAILTRGGTRWGHILSAVLTIAVVLSLQWRADLLARALSGVLLASAVWTTASEEGWHRVPPILLQVFGAIVLAGLVTL